MDQTANVGDGRARSSDIPDVTTAWEAVCTRDSGFADRFVYAVKTTGIYCSPGCGSRTPNRENVEFFSTPEKAEDAGYRACKRCRPNDQRPSPAYRSIEKARRYLDEHLRDTVTLEELGRVASMSPHHLQRTFKKYVGLTPREYVEVQRANVLKQRLRDGQEVGRAVYEAGYSSTSRLYEQADSHLGMTPGTYQRGGEGMRIRYATAATPVGKVLVAATKRGVCKVSLGESEKCLVSELQGEHDSATIEPADDALKTWIRVVVDYVHGRARRLDLPLDVEATTFQWRVWRALREIPYGATATYGEIARAVGVPEAARAVGNACAENPAALIIPCHRVVRQDGSTGGYRWGEARKAYLLDLESRRVESN